MAKWNVEGADARTGQDRVETIEADTQQQAELVARKLRLVVSSIHQAPDKTPAKALEEMTSTGTLSPSPTADRPAVAGSGAPPVVQYYSPTTETTDAGTVPTYGALKVGAGLLTAFAILYYLVSGIVLLTTLAQANNGAFPSGVGIGASITAAMVGVLLHAGSAACLALRDIARNSFR